MFELILVAAACTAMSRVAEADGNSGFMWGAITFGLCLACFLIPLPFLRIGLACLIVFGLMTVTKKTAF